jgi:hypothetical protein
MNQVGVFNSVPSQEEFSDPGTLMWISEDAGEEFLEAYQHCAAHAPQIAMRSSVVDGLQRPAVQVRAIVIAASADHALAISDSRHARSLSAS